MNHPKGQIFDQEEIKVLISELKKTINWTYSLAQKFDPENGNYGTVFRQTNPLINGAQLYQIEGNYTTWNIDDYSTANYEKALYYLTEIRNEWTKTKGPFSLNKNGRILAFLTQVTTHDSAPIVESSGFVDEGDVPPIDTWFYLKDKFYGHGDDYSDLVLLCWIPDGFEHQMQAAIDVEILDSYDWLDKLNPMLNEQIMKSL